MRQRRFLAVLFLLAAGASAALAFQPTAAERARWRKEARDITILRDDWGIAHIYGKTDAEAVFGAEYAQAEDDFNRVETNYINAAGRLAEAEGEAKIYQDLRMRLFMDPAELERQYAASPPWLKTLMRAFADGLNFYLYKHPEVHPRVIRHFEPWMALTFTEGSIGGDYERVNVPALAAFYGSEGARRMALAAEPKHDPEPSGSNGLAVAPANTTAHRALLLINPHTSFFFRSELEMASEQGLDAYGAVTWGQFFVYQGFNDRAGWMHTSSGVDAIDEYLETVTERGGRFFYRYAGAERPVETREVTIRYRTAGGMAEKKFTIYRTQHGPVIRRQNGKWVAIALMNEPVKALTQSWLRTKARNYQAFRQTMELHTNSSNNTIYADADGHIAYFHANFIPRRDPRFDWTKPVDGSDPATDWHGLLSVDESPHLLDPKGGWLYNSNNWPWSAAGPDSPKRADFPPYVETHGESARGLHAIRVLQGKKDFTLDGLIAAAFDSYLPWFEKPLPALIRAWERAPQSDPLKARLREQIEALRAWNLRWGVDSVPTTLAVFWGQELKRRAGPGRAGVDTGEGMADLPPTMLLQSLEAASDKLRADFGTWKTPWGAVNRFQRLTDDIVPTFHDDRPSIPVGFTSSEWGSLAAFGAHAYPGTKKWYGTSGNSFVAVVEFGPRVRAKAVTAGGESGHPHSRHFNDEAGRYATGNLREVYFYREQLRGHTEREYHPGE